MSYLIVVKGKYGTVITSDSYSTFNNRTLKDDNYKKITEIIIDEKERNLCYIGITGLNTVLFNNQLVDINDIVLNFFIGINDKNIEGKVDEFNLFLKDSCDKYCVDISYVLAYKNILYDVTILNNSTIIKNFIPFYQYGVVVLGEKEYKEWSSKTIDENIINYPIDCIENECKNILHKVIKLENDKYPFNQRVVGGNIQQASIVKKELSDIYFGRKII